MSSLGFVLVTLFAVLGVEAGRAEDVAPPVIAIYTESFRRVTTNAGPQIIAALWADGRIVWSATATYGGPPYREGKFPTEKLTKLLDRLAIRDAFTDKALARAWFGPDAAYTTIVIRQGQRRLEMRSWHELAERGTNLVALASGITLLRGRNRENLLQSEPPEYRRFRETWSEVRRAVSELIPETGEPYSGSPLQGR
jgi:hypothetical protein